MNGYDRQVTGDVALVSYVQPGDGPVVVLQHGLCGDARQPAEVFPAGHGYRHAVLEARGHGGSELGPVGDLSIARFADDLAGFIEAQTLRPVAVGGISMGAAIALRLAVLRPDLVRALILSRPAWGVEAAPANMAPNAEVGAMLTRGAGVADFEASAVGRLLLAAPDNLASLRGFFAREPLAATAALLSRISADGPGVSEADLAGLTIPVLILGSEEDYIHPLAHAQRLRDLIPGAVLVELPPKGRDRLGHVAASQHAILQFLKGLPHAASKP